MTLPILALDPGTTETGFCLFDGKRVVRSGIASNPQIISTVLVYAPQPDCILAIEMIASYGMAVGREVFETCVWIGRFQQAWREPGAVQLVFRNTVKVHLCGSARAKDPNIRQALLDALGPQGTKARPGPTYGVRSHAWSALAVAVTVAAARDPEAPAPGLFRAEQPERSVETNAEFFGA